MYQIKLTLISLLLLLSTPLQADTELENARTQIVELEAENNLLRDKLTELEKQMDELQQQIEKHAVNADEEVSAND